MLTCSVGAPILGLILDAKFLIALGTLLYLTGRSRGDGGDIILDVCKAILLIGLANAPFILRDIFSSGVSLSGIRLLPSNIFGYVPVGLFSHKVNVALLCSISFSASLVLYIFTKQMKFLFYSLVFIVLLLLSSSLKELGILFAAIIVVTRSLNNRKSKISSASKRLIFIALMCSPLMASIFGPSVDYLVSSRINLYVLQESTRKALYVKSAEIAADHFPLGSGAGTYSSEPSRSLYYSPLYSEYGLSQLVGASEGASSFLMDAGWPKFIGEAGWIGGGAYFFAYVVSFIGLMASFFKQPTEANVFGIFIGVSVFSSAIASAVFTGAMGLMLCALFFYCVFLDKSMRTKLSSGPIRARGPDIV